MITFNYDIIRLFLLNKLVIPAILVATVMVAGMFAFVPVQQASTVHDNVITTLQGDGGLDLDDIQSGTMVLQKVSADADGLDLDDGDDIRVDCNVPFTIVGLWVGEDEGIDAADNFDIEGVFIVGAGAGGVDFELGTDPDGGFTYLTAADFLLDLTTIDVFSALQTFGLGGGDSADLKVDSVVSDGSPVDFLIDTAADDDEVYDVDALIITSSVAECTVTGTDNGG